ncbi:envelope stress response protein PspG [Photobacterium phosphoreum]|jgi:phage shock protein G|uniref:Envelope stress response protein PspG n=1 Tax=Photobacterium phosphoreum TaxID=659 RepID=A0A2T3JEI4_PHOPO|nr:envelope stress response protein PspG [Photobacterium phosphoreum]KJF85654.1 phage-shock protein [Photobacterium phosphoreum]MCD9464714.1 envelope stress response protein PspG [Photobacterium phosphoreum]MCD9472785.1 envelope stress response protein PspG [Photobacterium phosphoreum]MCD9481276.1 envelope stress response protein PspG [Photobacterium phosphoreum]MCD9485228.1 envelope stress response protein PspG [Photobacterium phosphoreum]
MFEFLFLVAFTLVLIFTGVSLIGVLIAVAAGFAVMAVVGMLGLVFKLLPWIIVIALGIWFFRERNADKQHQERMSRHRRD